MECEAGCGHEAEMRVWTDVWAWEGEGIILNLCLECTSGFLEARYKQECMELGIQFNESEMSVVCCPNCMVWHVLPPQIGKYIPLCDVDRPMTIGDLISMLLYLPKDTPIVETHPGYVGKIAVGSDVIQVFERDGYMELHLDDGLATFGDLDFARRPIYSWYRERPRP